MFTITRINSLCPDTIYASIKAHGLIQLTHTFQDRDAFVAFAQSLGELYKWSFGVVNELQLTHQTPNYLYSEEAVPFHWDGAFAQSPHLLLFHCVEADQNKEGGETLFVNSSALYHSFSDSEKQILDLMTFRYATEKLSHYGGSIEQNVIDVHPYTGLHVLRFAEAVHSSKNPVYRTLKNANKKQIVMTKELESRLYSPEFCYAHRWCSGDILIADNHSLLHGRNALKGNITRHIRRIQVI